MVQLCKVNTEKQFDIHHQLNTVRIPSTCTTAMYTSAGVSHLRWSRREEQDFARVIAFFGVIYDRECQSYNWDRFRQLANLGKKSNDRLTTYYIDFRNMCQRVINGQRAKKGLLWHQSVYSPCCFVYFCCSPCLHCFASRKVRTCAGTSH